MSSAKQITADYSEGFKRTELNLETRAAEFHKKVDEKMQRNKTHMQQIKSTNLTILHQQEQTVSDGLQKIKREIKECEDILRNGNIENLLHHGHETPEKEVLLKLKIIKPPEFKTSPIDTKSFQEMYGRLTEDEIVVENVTTHAKAEQAQPDLEDVEKSSCNATNKPENPQKQLIPKPSVVSVIDSWTETETPNIVYAGSGHIWMEIDGHELHLINERRCLQDAIELNFSFTHVVLSHQGDILLASMDENCIKFISRGLVKPTLSSPLSLMVRRFNPDMAIKTMFKTQ